MSAWPDAIPDDVRLTLFSACSIAIADLQRHLEAVQQDDDDHATARVLRSQIHDIRTVQLTLMKRTDHT